MICPNCFRQSNENEIRCQVCDFPLRRRCPRCQHANEYGARQCVQCAMALEEVDLQEDRVFRRYQRLRKAGVPVLAISIAFLVISVLSFYLSISLVWYFSIVGIVCGLLALAGGIVLRRQSVAKFIFILGSATVALSVTGLIISLLHTSS